jgi:hypothetical protein
MVVCCPYVIRGSTELKHHHDRDGIRRSVLDWLPCSNDRAGAVLFVDCTSNMLTNWRLIISMGIDGILAMPISKPYMDIAMTRKPGTTVNTSR